MHLKPPRKPTIKESRSPRTKELKEFGNLLGSVLDYNKGLQSFVQFIRQHGLTTKARQIGQVVFADDQLVNREAIRIKMEHLGLNKRVSIFSDGQETVQHIERVVNSIEFNCLDPDSINSSETAV